MSCHRLMYRYKYTSCSRCVECHRSCKIMGVSRSIGSCIGICRVQGSCVDICRVLGVSSVIGSCKTMSVSLFIGSCVDICRVLGVSSVIGSYKTMRMSLFIVSVS